jgi:large subunit ribosomal protein L30
MKLKITYSKSIIKGTASQIATVRSLGFRRLNQTRIVDDTPAMRGMITKVGHLVKVEEVEG